MYNPLMHMCNECMVNLINSERGWIQREREGGGYVWGTVVQTKGLNIISDLQFIYTCTCNNHDWKAG